MQKQLNSATKYTIEAAIQRADKELGDRELGELEATLAEDDRSVSVLLRARRGEWFGIGFDLAKAMRPHVFHREFREPIEAFIVAAIGLQRTGYSIATAKSMLPASFMPYLPASIEVEQSSVMGIDLARAGTLLKERIGALNEE